MTISSAIKSIHEHPTNGTVFHQANKNFQAALKRLHSQLKLPAKLTTDLTEDILSENICFLSEIENPDSADILTLLKEECMKKFRFKRSKTWNSEKDLNHPIDMMVIQCWVRNVAIETTNLQVLTVQEANYIKAEIGATTDGTDLTD